MKNVFGASCTSSMTLLRALPIMPPRIVPVRAARALPFRLRARDNVPIVLRAASRRTITANEKPLPTQDQKQKPGPTDDQLPHVSEEAAEMGKITGEGGPELSQGTPIQEVLNRDKESKENAPKVMQDAVEKASSPSGSRSYSTTARRMQSELIQYEDETAVAPGHKFGMPAIPLGPKDHIKFRYDPVIKQVTALLMKDGQLSKAQTNMARILNHLRMSPPPKVNPQKPLLPGAPPAQHLPLNPVLYLQLAIDSVAPLLKIRSAKGMAGGGASLQLPQPLNIRQRRRVAVKWIVDTASKKPSKGSGRGQFAQRVAEEIIGVVEGRSGVWEKRIGVHRIGTSARSNLSKADSKRNKKIRMAGRG